MHKFDIERLPIIAESFNVRYIPDKRCRESATFIWGITTLMGYEATLYEGMVTNTDEFKLLIKSHEWVVLKGYGIIDIALTQVNGIKSNGKVCFADKVFRKVPKGFIYTKNDKVAYSTIKERLGIVMDTLDGEKLSMLEIIRRYAPHFSLEQVKEKLVK